MSATKPPEGYRLTTPGEEKQRRMALDHSIRSMSDEYDSPEKIASAVKGFEHWFLYTKITQ